MKTSEILREARKKIENPANWAKGPDGISIKNNRNCAMTALEPSDGYSAAMRYLTAEIPNGFYGVSSFNDDPATTHADVLELYDRAITLAETEEESAPEIIAGYYKERKVREYEDHDDKYTGRKY